METAERLALWADELRALTANGLRFSKSPYDEANYQRIRQIAAEMFALADGRSVCDIEALLLGLLGHYTPMVMGDALVINPSGEILLIQRADSGLWAAPGGAFDVNETAAEGAVRECYEETGWSVEPVALVGIYDSRVVGTFQGQHVYHLGFLCQPLGHDPTPGPFAQERLDMGWYKESYLPPLDVGHRMWVPDALRFWGGELKSAHFDRTSPP
jgi:ADP-ribose pyrophosphatase YjhB (NUDIX family)